MATLNTISEVMNLIDTKKENLKKAFENLQSHSSFLSSLPFSWFDLDSHFTSLHQSLTNRFNRLQSLDHSHSQFKETLTSKNPNPNNTPLNQKKGSAGVFPKNYVVPGSVKPSFELSVLCEKMDGIGLRNYVENHYKDRVRVSAELPGEFRCAPYPGEMVLESLEGFHDVDDGGFYDWDLRELRKSCIVLLKNLGLLI